MVSVTSGTSTLEDRVARRAMRRTQVRRRRVTALASVLGLTALIAGVVVSRGEDGIPRHAAEKTTAAPTKPRPVPVVAAADPLGSGKPVTFAF